MFFPAASNRRASLSAMKVSSRIKVNDDSKIGVVADGEGDLPLRQLFGGDRGTEKPARDRADFSLDTLEDRLEAEGWTDFTFISRALSIPNNGGVAFVGNLEKANGIIGISSSFITISAIFCGIGY